MAPFHPSRLAVMGVLLLIVFLAYSSQYLLLHLEPQPLTSRELTVFNGLLAALLVCYYRSVRTDPGPIARVSSGKDAAPGNGDGASSEAGRHRFCRKCNSSKPLRAHHCRTCNKCIPKMDHHCPWTMNCVSHTTFPHFVRFLFYAVVAMTYLEAFLYTRLALLWDKRRLPHYLGPSPSQLAHLFILSIANTLTLFALAILLARSVWCLAVNTTTIEGWEIERHEALVDRARRNGNVLFMHNGQEMKIVKQEFPYDVGIWSNIVQGMGSSIPLFWFWPFAATPSIESGLEFPTNGFEDEATTWPPPDPDRMASANKSVDQITKIRDDGRTDDERILAFKARQAHDIRYRGSQARTGSETNAYDASNTDDAHEWTNAEGEKLADFGLDEEAEFYDDDVPLSQLVTNHKMR